MSKRFLAAKWEILFAIKSEFKAIFYRPLKYYADYFWVEASVKKKLRNRSKKFNR